MAKETQVTFHCDSCEAKSTLDWEGGCPRTWHKCTIQTERGSSKEVHLCGPCFDKVWTDAPIKTGILRKLFSKADEFMVRRVGNIMEINTDEDPASAGVSGWFRVRRID